MGTWGGRSAAEGHRGAWGTASWSPGSAAVTSRASGGWWSATADRSPPTSARAWSTATSRRTSPRRSSSRRCTACAGASGRSSSRRGSTRSPATPASTSTGVCGTTREVALDEDFVECPDGERSAGCARAAPAARRPLPGLRRALAARARPARPARARRPALRRARHGRRPDRARGRERPPPGPPAPAPQLRAPDRRAAGPRRRGRTAPPTCGILLDFIGAWRSLVARTVRVGEVPGSNPGAPIEAHTAGPGG